jgi:hypothetical protein
MNGECICCGAELTGRNAFPLPLHDAMCTDCAREAQELLRGGPEHQTDEACTYH